MGALLIALNTALLFADLVIYATLGMTLAGSNIALNVALILVLAGIWLNFYISPGKAKEWFMAELVFVVTMMVLLTNTASLFQYGAIAIGLPFADWWLAAADNAIGVNVGTFAAWTFAHPVTKEVFDWAYFSFMPQMFFVIAVLAVTRDRFRLWEFTFIFHVCLIISVGSLVLFPAVCPPEYLGFTPTIDMTHLIGQIKDLHAGTLTVIRFDELEGLVSFPSFHVAGALAATWAMRGRPRIFIALILLNAVLVAATFVTGVHYLVDVLASFPLFSASLVLYRRLYFRWMVPATIGGQIDNTGERNSLRSVALCK